MYVSNFNIKAEDQGNIKTFYSVTLIKIKKPSKYRLEERNTKEALDKTVYSLSFHII